MATTDIFGRSPSTIKLPFTADKATIDWGGAINSAINVSVSYSQGIQRRRTIGNKNAVIWATMPIGGITIARLLVEDSNDLFSQPGWRTCEGPATIHLTFRGGCDTALGNGSLTLTALGCYVSTFRVAAEAEGLTVIDDVAIEFLQLQADQVVGSSPASPLSA